MFRRRPDRCCAGWRVRSSRHGSVGSLAYVIDHLPLLLITGVGWLVLENSITSACDVTPSSGEQICFIGPSTVGLTVMWIAVLVAAGLLRLELRLPPGNHRIQHRQVGAGVPGRQRENRGADRVRLVGAARARPRGRRGHLLRRLPVPALGCQAPDAGRQDAGHGVPAAEPDGSRRRPRTRLYGQVMDHDSA